MYRKLFILGNIVLLLLFVAAVVKDLAGPYFPLGGGASQLEVPQDAGGRRNRR